MTDSQRNKARYWAGRYVREGLNPLPMCPDKKHPILKRYSRFWERAIPRSWPRKWWSDGIQVVLGTQWTRRPLCVLDLDGPEAMKELLTWIREDSSVEEFSRMKTWVSAAPTLIGAHLDYSHSRHLWFRIPPSFSRLPTTTLWQPDPKKGHPQIRLLADRSLAVVPPTVHPFRKRPYEWLSGPQEVPDPAEVPRWLRRRLRGIWDHRVAPRPRPLVDPLAAGFPSGPSIPVRHYQRDDVLEAIGDRKHEIAQIYGLEVKTQPNLSGFHDCRAPDRDDNDWSCTIDPRTGVLTDFGFQPPRKIPFFSVLMALDPVTFPCYSLTVDKVGSIVLGGKLCPSPRSHPSPSRSRS